MIALSTEGDATQVGDIKDALVNAVSLVKPKVSDEFIPSAQLAFSKLTSEILPTATKSAVQGSLDLLDVIERAHQAILDSI
jgi:hypothetical protein